MGNSNGPCVSLQPIDIPSIPLPFGAQLQALADLSKGPPTNCALIHSLMLQLMPTLAGMTCVMKILGVIKALQDFATDPLTRGGDLISAIDKVAGCFNMIAPTALLSMIKAILLLLIAYLRCFVEAVESIVNFQAGIDLNSAQGNPVLLASLSCASDNAQVSMGQLMQAIGAVQPLMDLIKPIMSMANLSIELPSISQISGSSNPAAALQQLDTTLGQLQQIVDAIPG